MPPVQRHQSAKDSMFCTSPTFPTDVPRHLNGSELARYALLTGTETRLVFCDGSSKT